MVFGAFLGVTSVREVGGKTLREEFTFRFYRFPLKDSVLNSFSTKGPILTFRMDNFTDSDSSICLGFLFVS